jgi:hypothetical protein
VEVDAVATAGATIHVIAKPTRAHAVSEARHVGVKGAAKVDLPRDVASYEVPSNVDTRLALARDAAVRHTVKVASAAVITTEDRASVGASASTIVKLSRPEQRRDVPR